VSNKLMAFTVALFWFILFAFADFIFSANGRGELSNVKSIIYFTMMSFFLLMSWIYMCTQK